MSLSIIIPTIGRPTLIDATISVLPQLEEGDELIVVSDGHLSIEGIVELDPRIRPLWTNETHDSGNTQRDWAIARAKGTHLCFLDDDDIFTPTALSSFKRAINIDPFCPWIFRMKYGQDSQVPGLILWDEPKVEICHVGTPMYLIPNRPDLPKWKTDKQLAYSDYFWLDRVLKECYTSVDDVRFDRDIVCIVRPGKDEIE